MIKSDIYNEIYFGIHDLKNKLNEPSLEFNLWCIKESELIEALKEYIPQKEGSVISLYKDKSSSKVGGKGTLYRGVFLVVSDKQISINDMKYLLSNHIKSNPKIDRSLKTDKLHLKTKEEINVELGDTIEKKDLNLYSKQLDKNNLIFGVLDDIGHLEYISKIEGVEIIKEVGDFKKIYFSVPSYRRSEAMAHSVSFIKDIKCKQAIMDYVENK